MSAMASQITGVAIVYSAVCSGGKKKTTKLRFTGLCEGSPPVTGGFHSQRSRNAKNDSIWWRHHVVPQSLWYNDFLTYLHQYQAGSKHLSSNTSPHGVDL